MVRFLPSKKAILTAVNLYLPERCRAASPYTTYKDLARFSSSQQEKMQIAVAHNLAKRICDGKLTMDSPEVKGIADFSLVALRRTFNIVAHKNWGRKGFYRETLFSLFSILKHIYSIVIEKIEHGEGKLDASVESVCAKMICEFVGFPSSFNYTESDASLAVELIKIAPADKWLSMLKELNQFKPNLVELIEKTEQFS